MRHGRPHPYSYKSLRLVIVLPSAPLKRSSCGSNTWVAWLAAHSARRGWVSLEMRRRPPLASFPPKALSNGYCAAIRRQSNVTRAALGYSATQLRSNFMEGHHSQNLDFVTV